MEISALACGPQKLALRAQEIAETCDFRLACHLIEHALNADPDNKQVNAIRGEIYQARVARETSLMSKGIFGHAARESIKHSE